MSNCPWISWFIRWTGRDNIADSVPVERERRTRIAKRRVGQPGSPLHAETLRLRVGDFFRTQFRKVRFIPRDRTVNAIDNMFGRPHHLATAFLFGEGVDDQISQAG
jgi:hypothetical protein